MMPDVGPADYCPSPGSHLHDYRPISVSDTGDTLTECADCGQRALFVSVRRMMGGEP